MGRTCQRDHGERRPSWQRSLLWVVAGLISAQRAEAHTSYFTGHYTLSGQHWQLVYKGPYDERSGCGAFTVLRLTPMPLTEPGQNSAQRVSDASASGCVVGVLDAEGMDFPRAGGFEGGVTVEVASPQVAERVGHPC